ncbi:MAG TPA: ATP-dependent DNA helicase RecG, partial [Patescibacteria group bacterium]|nr:ATP-dependent DNA helicase RecG [Patescibacteria group bacterium]
KLKINETLPMWLIEDFQLISLPEALRAIHLPKNSEELKAAQKRLGYEEVFCLSLASLLNKEDNKTEDALKIEFHQNLAKKFVGSLPFTLTDEQRYISWQIYKDIQNAEPMNRLIEGDVGSGKTVVALMAALMVIHADKQTAFMAPTELLARQHASTINNLLTPLKLEDKIVLLTGSLTQTQKSEVYRKIKNGQVKIIIGTQALLQSSVDMHSLALIIIDEQHRFGVDQRKTLMQKAGHMPHVLSLSATPIPRSLALTLYGELEISQLKQLPSGRKPIKTKIIAQESIGRLYDSVIKEIDAGRQVFIVCPNISINEESNVKSTEEVYEETKLSKLGKYKIGLLHGKLKNIDKNMVMKNFINQEIDILVSTTVIEVGVDIPNASVMIVHSSERFGLAQLHQLRGRVGRGQHQGYFYMLTQNDSPALKRLRALESSSSGFELAELDLELRGPGAIYGTLQHGALDLRIANLSDRELITSAVTGARKFIKKKENLLQYKELAVKVNQLRTVSNLN